MGMDVCCTPGGSEECYVLRVTAESRDMLSDPLQGGSLIVECCKSVYSALLLPGNKVLYVP